MLRIQQVVGSSDKLSYCGTVCAVLLKSTFVIRAQCFTDRLFRDIVHFSPDLIDEFRLCCCNHHLLPIQFLAEG
jgi:hypothetical protein